MRDGTNAAALLSAFEEGLADDATAGDAMPAALDKLAHSADADGAVLVRQEPDSVVGYHLSAEVADTVTDYVRSDRPPDPRRLRVNPRLDEGFRIDADDFSSEELSRNAFYQEFLRPRGYGWHACATLRQDRPGAGLYLSLKRRWKRGSFERRDFEALRRLLPAMRRSVEAAEAVSIANRLSAHWQGATDGVALLIDKAGHVLGFSPPEPLAGGLLSLIEGQLCGRPPLQRGLVGELVERATSRLAPASALLRSAPSGPSWSLKVVPTPRRIHRPWEPPTFVAVISEIRYRLTPDRHVAIALSDLFRLSVAEARVAALLSHGWTIETAARALGLSPGTVRNHLKAVFSKTAVNRQTDLAVLVSRL
jgi:DNA-binding CsgD family transcriptional regulator